MHRRDFLTGCAVSSLLGSSGCIGAFERSGGTNSSDTDGSPVTGCLQKDEWPSDITSTPQSLEQNSIADRRDCSDADRPEPTGDVCSTFVIGEDEGEPREYQSVGVKPYPNSPNSFTENTIVPFIYAYERAYSQNSAVLEYGNQLVAAPVTIKTDLTQVLAYNEEITVVGIEFAHPLTIATADGFSYEDSFDNAAVYGIDVTGILRGEATPDEIRNRGASDPVEHGSLLECF